MGNLYFDAMVEPMAEVKGGEMEFQLVVLKEIWMDKNKAVNQGSVLDPTLVDMTAWKKVEMKDLSTVDEMDKQTESGRVEKMDFWKACYTVDKQVFGRVDKMVGLRDVETVDYWVAKKVV